MTDPYDPPEQLLAEYDEASGIYLLTGWAPGPAGLAVADLGFDVEMAVDYARPATLASLTIGGGRHLRPRVAQFLDDVAGYGTAAMLRDVAASPGRTLMLHRDRGRRPQRGRGNDATALLGNVALLSELLVADDMGALRRATALLEMASFLRRALLPDRALLERVVAAAAMATDDAPLPPRRAAGRIAELAFEAASMADELSVRRLRDFARRCEEVPERLASMASAAPTAARAYKQPARLPITDLDAHRRAADQDDLTVSFPDPVVARVEVRPGRLHQGDWWARVFRRADGVVLGMAPVRDGATADVLVPLQLPDAELAVDVTTEPLEAPKSRHTALVTEAIAAGRRAADMARRGAAQAGPEWARCAALWQRLGDDRRAHLAREYAAAPFGKPGARDQRWMSDPRDIASADPLLVDEL